jgi:amino acid transporter
MFKITKEQKNFLKKVIPGAAFIGALCCFTPIVLVLFGISTVSFAASLADTLYFGYAWLFRSIALVFLLASLFWYFYKKEKICSINEFKRNRKRIVNILLLSIITFVILYIIWLYVVLEWIGIVLGIWG